MAETEQTNAVKSLQELHAKAVAAHEEAGNHIAAMGEQLSILDQDREESARQAFKAGSYNKNGTFVGSPGASSLMK